LGVAGVDGEGEHLVRGGGGARVDLEGLDDRRAQAGGGRRRLGLRASGEAEGQAAGGEAGEDPPHQPGSRKIRRVLAVVAAAMASGVMPWSSASFSATRPT